MGLNAGDLRNLVHDVFEVDNYRSKMGDDRDIITVSFVVNDREPANDLVQFIESGYDFVLDADATEGELENAKYRVFVEFQRDRKAIENIIELLDGVSKLADIEKWRFRYHKQFRGHEATVENLEGEIPIDPDSYDLVVKESNLNNYKHFFNRSFVDSVELMDDILTIRKIYSQPVQFKVLDFGDAVAMNETITETINFNDWAEIIFLTKYIGDYNITKYGSKLVIENGDKSLIVKRL
jgi:hypothetical protein